MATQADFEAFQRWQAAQQQANGGGGALSTGMGLVGSAAGIAGNLAPFFDNPADRQRAAYKAQQAVLMENLRKQQQQVSARASSNRGSPALAMRNAEQANEGLAASAGAQSAAIQGQGEQLAAQAADNRWMNAAKGLVNIGSSLAFGGGLAGVVGGQAAEAVGGAQAPLQVAPSQQPYRGGIGPGMPLGANLGPGVAAAQPPLISPQQQIASQAAPQVPVTEGANAQSPQVFQQADQGVNWGAYDANPAAVSQHSLPADPQAIGNQFASMMPNINPTGPAMRSMAHGGQGVADAMLQQAGAAPSPGYAYRGTPESQSNFSGLEAGQVAMRQGPVSSYAPPQSAMQQAPSVMPGSATALAQVRRRRMSYGSITMGQPTFSPLGMDYRRIGGGGY